MIIFLCCLLSAVVCLDASDNDVKLNKARLLFSTELFQEIMAKDFEKNVLFSPSSIYRALLTMYIASAGKTEKALEDILRFDNSSKPDKTEIMKTVFNQKQVKNENQHEYELDLIDRIFINKDVRVKKEMGKRFGETLAVFKTENERENEINNWISIQTKGMIRKLFNKGTLNADGGLVFANAAYFNGTWHHLLNGGTSEKPFALSDGSIVQTQFMSPNKFHRTFQSMTDVELNAQIISLPYRDSSVAMTIILPMAGPQEPISRIAEVVKALTSTKLQKVNSDLAKQIACETDLLIPRFEVEVEYDLKPIFKDLGASDFLDQDLDLTNLFEPQAIKVKQIKHKTRVNVYENGTIAAAATAIQVLGAVEKPCYATFHANRPFIYIIYDTSNNVAHYMGILKTPKQR